MITITKPREDRERRVRVQAARDDGAESAAADQAGDHDHREREEDRLVDAEQEHAPGERELHLRRASAGGSAPIEAAASTVFVAHAPDPERGDAHGGRDRVDHRRDDGGGRADREAGSRPASGTRRRGRSASRRERARSRGGTGRSGRRRSRAGSRSRSESPTATSISAKRLHALLPEARERRTTRTRRATITAARTPPKPEHERACRARSPRAR